MENLRKIYLSIKPQILKKEKEFKSCLLKNPENKIFAELSFCLLTPQSKAKICWRCVENLLKNNLLETGNYYEILQTLSGVRFKYKKAKFILKAREFFTSKNGSMEIKKFLIQTKNIHHLREWLAKSIKGLGLKEASHFLRNVGLGDNLAILDRHILRNLKKYKVIKEIPESLSKKLYYEIEKKMINFSKKIKIPMQHLDMVFWYIANKEIFK